MYWQLRREEERKKGPKERREGREQG